MSIRNITTEIEDRAKLVSSLLNKHLHENDSVLDIGCGHGLPRLFLKQCKYHGVECRRYPEHTFKNVVYLNLNTDSLPYKNASFDAIICTEVLEHLFDLDLILKEMRRVLKRTGVLVISLPNEITLDNRIRCLFGTYPPKINEFSHHWFFTLNEADVFVRRFFDILEKKYIFSCKGGRFMSQMLKSLLAKTFPSFFAGSQMYLLKFKNEYPSAKR